MICFLFSILTYNSNESKVVMNFLKANSPVDLNELKGQTGLSNKKWDKAIKGLTKNNLARVEKIDVSGLNLPVGAFLSPGCHCCCQS